MIKILNMAVEDQKRLRSTTENINWDIITNLDQYLHTMGALPILHMANRITDAFVIDEHKAVLITGIPVPPTLEETPSKSKYRASLKALPSDLMHYIFCHAAYTRPKIYEDEHNGNAIHNVTTVQGHDGEYSSSGNTEFPYHVEVPQDPCNPRWLSLCCLREDKSVKTSFINSDNLLEGLSDDELLYAKRDCMNLKINPSFFNQGHTLQIPIIRSNGAVVFDSVEMTPIKGDAKSVHIYDTIMANIEKEIPISVVLGVGDMLIINNRKVLHSRKTSKTINNDRWLTRMYHQ